MFLAFRPLAKASAIAFAVLVSVSSASAQPSAMGHVAARGFRPVYSPGGSTFQVYPGDRGFHSTMQIQRYYLSRERMQASAAPPPAPRYQAAPAEETMTSVAVTISEPAHKPVLVDIRGPDGKVRSFALAGGRETIQPQTIIVHAGEKLTIKFNGTTARLDKKP